MEQEKPIEANNTQQDDSKPKNRRWKYVVLLLIAIILALLLCVCCNTSKKYKIKIHNGDEIIEVDSNFKLSDLVVDGGKASFLVSSDGYIVAPDEKLDPNKEYSVHVIPDGKESVKVTYKNGDNQLIIEYQKGAGLLFPKPPTKADHVFMGWKNEDTGVYPKYMDPVNKDMVLVAQFQKSTVEDNKCILNCDNNNDGQCDYNCDMDGDGKPDMNVDNDGDGKCDLNCDTNNDGTPDKNIDNDGDGKCDELCEEDDMRTVYVNNTERWSCSDFDHKVAIWEVYRKDVTSVTIDGKDAHLLDTFDIVVIDVSEYLGTELTVEVIIKYIEVDGTGQKYYKIWNTKLEFEGNCDDTPQSTETPEEKYTCPSGYTLSETKCTKEVTDTKDAKINGYTCDSGYTLNDAKKCTKEVPPTCPSGFTDTPTGCSKTTSTPAKYRCEGFAAPLEYRDGKCYELDGTLSSKQPEAYCEDNSTPVNGQCLTTTTAEKGCYDGSTQKNTPVALICEKIVDSKPKYTCADYGSDYKLNGYKCIKTYTETIDATKE